MPYNSMKTICEGWFLSVMVYCLPLFGGCEKRDLQDIQVIQNKIVRLVTGSHPRRNREDMYEQIQWFTVSQLIVYHTMITVFRVRITGEPEKLASVLLYENRNSNIIFPSSNLSLYRGIFIWNTMPRNIRIIQKLAYSKQS